MGSFISSIYDPPGYLPEYVDNQADYDEIFDKVELYLRETDQELNDMLWQRIANHAALEIAANNGNIETLMYIINPN